MKICIYCYLIYTDILTLVMGKMKIDIYCHLIADMLTLIMGKMKIGIYCYLITDIFDTYNGKIYQQWDSNKCQFLLNENWHLLLSHCADILTKVLQNCCLSNPLPNIIFFYKPLNLIDIML